MIIIGVAGTLGAGKGAIVEHLKNTGFKHFSMSGFIAKEVERRGLPVNRDILVAVANDLRAKYGPGYIAEQLYKQAALTGDNCVIESIRTMGEVSALKARSRFYLFAVDAAPDLRYHRILLRDSSKDKISYEQFLKDEKREMESDDPNKQNLRACIQAADYRFTNEHTLDDLAWLIDSALSKIFGAWERRPEPKPPGRSLLSRDMILWHIEQGNIFIYPFNRANITETEDLKNNLQTTSYDVRLGEDFFEEQPFRASDQVIFNPFDPEHIKRYWGEPKKAIRAGDWMEKHGVLNNIYPDDRIIILGPGETILAHTQEFIGGRNCVTTEMRARSSMGRISTTVCKCAGWGDLGFCNRWTMEMTNHFKGLPVVLVVGMRVAQIIFRQVDPLKSSYSKSGGQYQTTDDTDEMMRNWSPYAMLPKFSREKY